MKVTKQIVTQTKKPSAKICKLTDSRNESQRVQERRRERPSVMMMTVVYRSAIASATSSLDNHTTATVAFQIPHQSVLKLKHFLSGKACPIFFIQYV
jgi:hypothetical protein